ncbi:MAG: DUF1405 domain-containing protein [Bacillus sp. (in: firmicutes)]
MVNLLYSVLRHQSMIMLLLLINIFGTFYGYIWYTGQLLDTEPLFLPFVPDSPTACLFFVFVLAAFLFRTNWGLFEALAFISLFKYGVWAVCMNLLTLYVTGTLHWTGYMLMASHLAMALQGLLYAPFYRIKVWHLSVAAVFTVHNEIIDYVFGQMPRYSQISMYANEIGYFTFWLSILSIFLCYWFGMRKERWTLTI